MGTLADMVAFLDDTSAILDDIGRKVGKIQEYFNVNFNNVTAVRTDEISRLQENFFRDRNGFPPDISRLFEKEFPLQEKIFINELAALKTKRDGLRDELKKKDSERIRHIEKLVKDNTRLDTREEKLKGKIEELSSSIEAYNRQIDELNTGFGFITNLLRMRKIQKDKDVLMVKRTELIEAIEEVRKEWHKDYAVMNKENKGIGDRWSDLQTELALAEEKLAYLETNREELINRAAFLGVLNSLRGHEDFLTASDSTEKQKKCRRCKSDNTGNRFFCRYCGERFSRDRPDITGSLMETGELNDVFNSLQSGIKETVSLIALMKGMNDGVKQFRSSVKDVKKSQDTYSTLPKLRIDIPAGSSEFALQIKKLHDGIKTDLINIHPADFSAPLKEITETVFTNKRIESFFTLMGDELNKRTKEQW